MHVYVCAAGMCVCANSLSISVYVWMRQCSTVWALFDEFGIGSWWFVDLSLYINRAASSRSTVSEMAERAEEKEQGVEAALDHRVVLAPNWAYSPANCGLVFTCRERMKYEISCPSMLICRMCNPILPIVFAVLHFVSTILHTVSARAFPCF